MPDAVYRGRYRGKKYKRKVKALDMPDPMKTSVPRLSMKSGNLLTSKGGDVTEESGRMLERALMRKSYEEREEIAKGRIVRTPAGAKRYGVPIGTPISAAKAKQRGTRLLEYKPGAKGKLKPGPMVKPGSTGAGSRTQSLMPDRRLRPATPVGRQAAKDRARRQVTNARRRQAARLGVEEIKTKSGAKVLQVKPEGRKADRVNITLDQALLGSRKRVGRSASEIRGLTGDRPPVGRKQRSERAKRQAENARRRQVERLADGAIGDLGGRPSSGRKPSSGSQASKPRGRTGVPEGLANQTKSPQSGSPIFNTPGAGSRRSQRSIGSDLPFNLQDGSPRQQSDESDADFALRDGSIGRMLRERSDVFKPQPYPKSKKKRKDTDEEISRRLMEMVNSRPDDPFESPPLRMG